MDPNEKRKAWISLLAKSPAEKLKHLFRQCDLVPDFDWLRPAEVGSAMVRGRMGGTGGAFNLGEMTVTRCSVQLSSGQVGHAYVQGRDKEKARIAALIDALMQTDQAEVLRANVLEPLQTARDASRTARASKAAATKVEFFTMVRGED